ncbi:hypothetical protein PsorP6_003577 [Peronosclerospora sorghi]|uniref:Uncharacterized protein n=1 Tax=Peronosclerospora sorghi TaxID=230839 RepID=A0ACC0VLP5_9STRA|nr:hypothetical protein PsorP6_003577 [Peronosclerospora sorghi]
MVTASIDSVMLPIWFTLSKSALQACCSIAFFTRVGFVTVRSSPTICTSLPILLVIFTHDSQSSWSNGSSIDTIWLDPAHFSINPSYTSSSFSAEIFSDSGIVSSVCGSCVELRGGYVHPNTHFVRVASDFYSLLDQVDRLAVRLNVRGESTLVANRRGIQAIAVFNHLLQVVINL